MKIDLNNLPANTDVLHQMIIDLINTLALKEAELELLKAKLYGKSSEKLTQQVADLEQQIEESEAAIAEVLPMLDNNAGPEDTQSEDRSATPAQQSTQQAKRKQLPEHLPRTDLMLNPDPQCPKCGGEDFRKISDDIAETLEYIPSSFKVIRHIRPRCVCLSCEQIVQAYPRSGGIDKGKAGPGLLAHILVQKYCNHLPFYRQREIYAREDIEISRSTMASWAGQSASLLSPLIAELKKYIFSASHLHGDDTPIKVLAPGMGKTKTGRIWVYVRDGRPYGDQSAPAVCYAYSPDRKGERPASHLENFTGIFHADAYGGYDKIYQQKDANNAAIITEAACWAHARRKFYEITVHNEQANVAYKILAAIGNIYSIEDDIRGLSADKRKEQRQKTSKALLDQLFIAMKKYRQDLPNKSATALAINYAVNNEVALRRFLADGKIEIDNNAAERALRSIALGRKNWLFAGSDRGGGTAANIYSLIETAKMNGVNPWRYLAKVLAVIQDYNSGLGK